MTSIAITTKAQRALKATLKARRVAIQWQAGSEAPKTRSEFAFPPCAVGERQPDGTQWLDVDVVRSAFRTITAASELLSARCGRRGDHYGWYCEDPEIGCDSVFRPYVLHLSHGRFVAGYAELDRGERGYDNEGMCIDTSHIFTCEYDAAMAADELARVDAENAMDSWQAEQAEFDAEQAREELEAILFASHA